MEVRLHLNTLIFIYILFVFEYCIFNLICIRTLDVTSDSKIDNPGLSRTIPLIKIKLKSTFFCFIFFLLFIPQQQHPLKYKEHVYFYTKTIQADNSAA